MKMRRFRVPKGPMRLSSSLHSAVHLSTSWTGYLWAPSCSPSFCQPPGVFSFLVVTAASFPTNCAGSIQMLVIMLPFFEKRCRAFQDPLGALFFLSLILHQLVSHRSRKISPRPPQHFLIRGSLSGKEPRPTFLLHYCLSRLSMELNVTLPQHRQELPESMVARSTLS